MPILNLTILSIPQHSNKIMSGKVVRIVFSHTWGFIRNWFCCVMTFVVSKCIEYGHKARAYWTRHHRTGTELWLWCTFIWRKRYFSLGVTNDSDTDDINDTHCTQWTDNTHCQTSVPVVHRFTGSPSGLWQCHPTLLKTPPTAFSCSSFYQLIFGGRDKQILHQYLDCLDKGQSLGLMWLSFKKGICFWQLLCRCDTIRGTFCKITGQLKKSITWPLKERLWKEAHAFMHSDLCILATTKMNLIRPKRLQPTVENENYTSQALIHMLHITPQLNL